MRRSTLSSLSAGPVSPAFNLGRAGEPQHARPASFSHIPAEPADHFQSDDDFAIVERIIAATVAANRASDRLFTLIGFAIVLAAMLAIVLPALCMALAGGAPA